MTNRNAATMGTYGSTWQRHGYSGTGDVVELLDSITGPALICGGAEGVFDEIRLALLRYPNATIFAVNEVGMFLPRVDHFVTLHTANVAAWKQVRWLHPHDGRTRYHGVDALQSVDYNWSNFTVMLP